MFTSEVQHATMASVMTAQPARWMTVTAKSAIAACFGLAMGALGMIGGLSGTLLGGLDSGDTSTMPAKVMWGLFDVALAPLFGLGIGMILRHSAAAVSILLVWVFVVENIIRTLMPAHVHRFLPFSVANGLLGTATGANTAEVIAADLSQVQDALLFGGYAAAALTIGTVLLYRRDMNCVRAGCNETNLASPSSPFSDVITGSVSLNDPTPTSHSIPTTSGPVLEAYRTRPAERAGRVDRET